MIYNGAFIRYTSVYILDKWFGYISFVDQSESICSLSRVICSQGGGVSFKCFS